MVFQKSLFFGHIKKLKDFKNQWSMWPKQSDFYGNGLELAIGIEVLNYYPKEQKNKYLLGM